MSFLSKVAVAAAMTLSIAGLAVASSAGLAAEAPAPIAAIPPAIAPQAANVVSVPKPMPAIADVQPGDQIVYPTLAAAVAAQQTQGEVSKDLRCLAGAIYYESKGEPLAGQLAVAVEGLLAALVFEVGPHPGDPALFYEYVPAGYKLAGVKKGDIFYQHQMEVARRGEKTVESSGLRSTGSKKPAS